MSISTDDFIKNIFLLAEAPGSKASGSSLAKRMDISKAAVTDMLKKLSEKGLVNYERYSIPVLTPAGNKMALQIIRRHRIWEAFLHEVLNLPWQHVHHEAEQLEHQTSEYLLEHLEKKLGYPEFDPHGDPIPDTHGNMPVMEGQMLFCDIRKAGTYRITRISDHSEKLVALFRQNKLSPGDIISVKTSKDNSLNRFSSGENEISLTEDLSKEIYVTPINI